MQQKLGLTAYLIIKELNNLKDNLNKNLIIGLDHYNTLPNEFKIKLKKKSLISDFESLNVK